MTTATQLSATTAHKTSAIEMMMFHMVNTISRQRKTTIGTGNDGKGKNVE